MLLAWYSRTGWFREHQFGQRLAAGGFGKFCSPEQLRPANIRSTKTRSPASYLLTRTGTFCPPRMKCL